MHAAAENLARAAEKTDFMMNAVMPATRLVNRFGMVSIAMQNGNIIEQGNHAQLLAQNGAYAELYNSQFA